MRILQSISILACGSILLWLLAGWTQIGVAYRSVEQVGERFSLVLPSGEDIGSHQYHKQVVRVEHPRFSDIPDRLPANLVDPTSASTVRTKVQNAERYILPAFLMCACLMIVLPRMRAAQHNQMRRPLRQLVQINLCAASLIVSLGLMFTALRVFLTGIDNGLVSRSMGTFGQEFNNVYAGQDTLAMSMSALIMMYIGLGVLTLTLAKWSCDLLMPKRVVKRLSFIEVAQRSHIVKLGLACYLLVIGTFILAPWTNTFVGRFLQM